ncbi:FAD-binding oxidoreductase [Achromobacter xylosoxidans]|uniref:FAD-binding oxidoreductase n=1 Tax=Alcaligenes xylosoxydans xylosoxydans TaxID=85698 RepID=UPI001F145788|nr:FAD-binding oxidoreductase [Achromobacter xylosoxidans]
MSVSPFCLDDMLHTLRDIVGAQYLLTEAHDTQTYTTDWRGRYYGRASCVVLPGTTEEVARVVRCCVASGVAVVPQGGNTGLVGAAVPDYPAGAGGRPDVSAPVVLNLRRMNRILHVDPVGNTITVQAGCILAHVQEEADRHERSYGVSLGAEGSCQIGGNIATNAGGTGVIKYGSTRENVLGLEVVLPDGQIWNGLRGLRKDNAGYALRHLFIGSEGTLGIVTAATLKLYPRPRAWSAAWLTADSVAQALQGLVRMQSLAGDRIATFELLNRKQLDIVKDHIPGLRIPADPQAPYAMLVELSDTYADADLDGLMERALSELLEAGLLRDVAIAANGAQREAFWRIRHGISEANRSHGMGLSTDVAVPVADVGDFIEQATAEVLTAWPKASIVLVAHLGDGNVHFIPMFEHEDWRVLPDRDAVADEVRARVHDVAARFGGTFSAEHGVGFVLAGELARLRAPVETALMRRIKHALDETGLQNPGKIFS